MGPTHFNRANSFGLWPPQFSGNVCHFAVAKHLTYELEIANPSRYIVRTFLKCVLHEVHKSSPYTLSFICTLFKWYTFTCIQQNQYVKHCLFSSLHFGFLQTCFATCFQVSPLCMLYGSVYWQTADLFVHSLYSAHSLCSPWVLA